MVVNDNRSVPQACDQCCRRRAKMPGPARVGQHMDHLRSPARPPQIQQIGQQANGRTHYRQAPKPRRPIRRVGAYQFHIDPFISQQAEHLLALIRHPTRRRRQGSDQADRWPACASLAPPRFTTHGAHSRIAGKWATNLCGHCLRREAAWASARCGLSGVFMVNTGVSSVEMVIHGREIGLPAIARQHTFACGSPK